MVKTWQFLPRFDTRNSNSTLAFKRAVAPVTDTANGNARPSLMRGETWRANHRHLMEQAPEMGIAVLNSKPDNSCLRFSNGLWELAVAKRAQLSSSSGFDRAGEGFKDLRRETRALVVEGIGLGYWFLRARHWLQADPLRQLIFFETDVTTLSQLLHMPWAEALLKHPQVLLKCAPNDHLRDRIVKEIAWSSLLLPLQCVAGEYALPESDSLKNLEIQVLGFQGHFDQMAGELLGFSEPFYKNFAKNYFTRSHAAEAAGLLGAFTGVPVIVCGAGPSLLSQLSQLSHLKHRVLVLAGGSGINALCAASCTPHFGLGIDPNPLQEQRVRASCAFEVPYLFRRRLFAPSLAAVHGPKVLVRGAAGYPLANWLDEQEVDHSPDQDIEEGHNVIHLGIDIARYLGSTTICLCGIDLAYLGRQREGYAAGVLAGHVDSGLRPQGLCCDEPLIKWQSDRAEEVWTHWKWVEEAQWISDYSQRHPDIALFNAAPAGLGMPGIRRVALQKWASLLNCPMRDLYNLVWLQLQIAQANLEPKRIGRERLKPVFESLNRCQSLCEQLQSALESFSAATSGDTGLAAKNIALQEYWSQIEGELAYLLILRFPDQMHKVILDREQRALAGVAPGADELALAELAVQSKRCLFLQRGIDQQRCIWEGAIDEVVQEQLMHTPEQLMHEPEQLMHEPEQLMSSSKGDAMRRRLSKLQAGDETQLKNGELLIQVTQLGINLRLPACDETLEPTSRAPVGANSDLNKLVHRVHDRNGQLAEMYLERSGRREGQTLQYYPSGARKSEAFYFKDQLHGPSSFYLESGELTSRSWFASGQRQGWVQQYYKGGRLYSVQGFCDDTPHGLHCTFYADGQPKSRISYQHGKLVGIARLFHSNGKLARRTCFQGGVRYGWDRHWSLQGHPLFEAQYINGVPQGRTRRWHPNGRLAEVLKFLEPGGRVETRQFSDNGAKISQGVYSDQVHYTLRAWDARGKLVEQRELLWREGQLVPSEVSPST